MCGLLSFLLSFPPTIERIIYNTLSSANDVVESVNVVNTIILTITIFTIHKLMILLTITVLF